MDKTKVQFGMEFQWNRYVQRCGLTMEQLKAVPDQYREMKRAFMGGMGQAFFLITQDVADLPDMEAVRTLQQIQDEIGDFWQHELIKNDNK